MNDLEVLVVPSSTTDVVCNILLGLGFGSYVFLSNLF